MSDLGALEGVVLVGAGNMGGAMLSGWVSGGVKPQNITVIDPNPSDRIKGLLDSRGIRHAVTPPDNMKAKILILAVKPQVMYAVLETLHPVIDEETLVISVAAGKTLSYFEERLGALPMVRTIPNTPSMIGRGVIGAFANERVGAEDRTKADILLSAVGHVEWVGDEADIDAVTAVAGSGPAYVFYLVECMAEAARKLGLDEDLAMRLARETVIGAGALLDHSGEEAGVLRKNVTSPGGTTAAALSHLMAEDGLQPVFDAALKAARDRSRELSG
ncbi:pyrroline-5-carboxylate reductase [Martelella mediterranea]|uniref:Pyrroline-5-carboxylate reductase n=1 Tax=Martelella mediterranea TaxID=293089 RepID=A0A4R3NUJ8_9HYPH|nr:pyrroline-5-carboxylate reductase [Martelella mediterranea]TCT40204.1 pyrroline-5-carboxylate reductase [Martelella mediterranea]